jgi:hypothetical protein
MTIRPHTTSRDFGTLTLATLAAGIALGLLAVSVAVSFEIGRSFGRTETETLLYGTACACADALKALLVALSVAAYRRSRTGLAVIGFALFALLTVFSFTSSVSFGLVSRIYAGDVQLLQAEQNRSTVVALHDDQHELARIRTRLRDADLSARERRDLERRNDTMAAAVADRQKQLALAPRIMTANTQADAIARILGVAPEAVTAGLAILLALTMDLGPGVGLTVAMAIIGTTATKPQPTDKARAPKRPQPPRRPNLRLAATGSKPAPNDQMPPDHSDLDRSVRMFLGNYTVCTGFVDATELFRAYLSYRTRLNLPSVSQRAFGDAMRRLGHNKDRKTGSGRFRYLGVSLTTNLRAAA